jgi:hypothetical protein
MELILRGQLEQPPVDLGEPGQEPADLEMVFRHEANLGNPVFANIFGDGFAVELGGQVRMAVS